MATTPAPALTPSEQRKMQERITRLHQQAQELEDAQFIAEAEASAAADVAVLKDRLSSAMEDASHIDPEELKTRFSTARKEYAHSADVLKQAAHAQDSALVIMSRVAFQASVHPAIIGTGKQNISKAGEALGMPYSTIRPYVLAGGALFRHDRAFLLSEPEHDDFVIVNASFNANSRKAQIEKRQRAAIKAAESEAARVAAEDARVAAEAEAARLREALEAANGNGEASAPPADSSAPAAAPAAAVGNGEASAPTAAPTAPTAAPSGNGEASAPAAPAKSLADETADVAKQLVGMIALLRKQKQWSGDKGASKRVLSILSQSFPVLKPGTED
jgi:hypothetical protein